MSQRISNSAPIYLPGVKDFKTFGWYRVGFDKPDAEVFEIKTDRKGAERIQDLIERGLPWF